MYFGRKPPVRYICPFCYRNIDMKKLHCMCPNPDCMETYIQNCSEEEKRMYVTKEAPFKEIDYERCIYLKKDPKGSNPLLAKGHIVRSPRGGQCDICHARITEKLCPSCHEVLPPECANGTSLICFLGSVESGKSHLMAMMMRDLVDVLGPEFGYKVFPASKYSKTKASEKYVNRIYGERYVIPPTKPYSNSTEEERNPIMFFVGKPIDRAVAFMDTSGVDMDIKKDLSVLNVGSYIAGATGLIYAVDPTRIPDIAVKLGLPRPIKSYEPSQDLNKIVEVIQERNKMRAGKSIDIPLAIVLTKVDLLIGSSTNKEQDDVMFGPESSINLERAKGRYDAEVTANIGREVEEYLRRALGGAFIEMVNRFENHEYFAVTALGSNVQPNGQITTLGPYKTEEPLVWLLLKD